MLKPIFQIIAFFDYIRWHSISNYNLINYYKDTLSDDTRLLTHWLCYITDRQMAFERIWDVGGFIFSELADTNKNEKDLGLLNPSNPKSFIKENTDGFIFKCVSKCNGNNLLRRYNINESDIVTFSSRYYPSDYFSILFTLSLLSRYNYSLTEFFSSCYRQHVSKDDFISRILFSFYLMTYHEIGQPSKKDLYDFDKNLILAEKHTQKVFNILNSNEQFETEYKKFNRERKFTQKRAWCSLRDFFKSPEFNKYFRNTLKQQNFSDVELDELFSLKSLQQFELPGDVWNNNSRFRVCILEGTDYQNSKQPLNKILRHYYDNNKADLTECYPEQFDITFDFVPRMCVKNNCDICPIGLLKTRNESNFYKSCVKNTELLCSVALIDCGYKIDCYGKECKLVEYKELH